MPPGELLFEPETAGARRDRTARLRLTGPGFQPEAALTLIPASTVSEQPVELRHRNRRRPAGSAGAAVVGWAAASNSGTGAGTSGPSPVRAKQVSVQEPEQHHGRVRHHPVGRGPAARIAVTSRFHGGDGHR